MKFEKVSKPQTNYVLNKWPWCCDVIDLDGGARELPEAALLY